MRGVPRFMRLLVFQEKTHPFGARLIAPSSETCCVAHDALYGVEFGLKSLWGTIEWLGGPYSPTQKKHAAPVFSSMCMAAPVGGTTSSNRPLKTKTDIRCAPLFYAACGPSTISHMSASRLGRCSLATAATCSLEGCTEAWLRAPTSSQRNRCHAWRNANGSILRWIAGGRH